MLCVTKVMEATTNYPMKKNLGRPPANRQQGIEALSSVAYEELDSVNHLSKPGGRSTPQPPVKPWVDKAQANTLTNALIATDWLWDS